MSPPKVREAIKASKSFSSNKGIEINDYKLSKIQDQSALAAYPLLNLWQNFTHNEELSYEDIAKSSKQSLVLLGSMNANLNILRRERVATILSKEYAFLVYDPSTKHCNNLFGEDLAEKVDKQNKEQRLMQKISVDSSERLPPKSNFLHSVKINPWKGWGPEKYPNQVCQKSGFKEERRSAPETVQSSSQGSDPTLMPVTVFFTVFFTIGKGSS